MLSLYFLCHARWIKHLNVSSICLDRSPPGIPTIITNPSLLSHWFVKHPIINSPIPLRLVKVVMLIDDRLPRSFENENEGGAESAETATGNATERTNKRFWTILLGELTEANWIKENNHWIQYAYAFILLMNSCSFLRSGGDLVQV